MMAAVVQKQIPFGYVMADTWFSSSENMVFIKHKLGKEFIMPLKNNRRVALSFTDKKRGRWVPLSSLSLDVDVSLTLYLEGVPFPVVVSRQLFTNEDGSQNILYLASSEVTLPGSSHFSIYQILDLPETVESRRVSQVTQEQSVFCQVTTNLPHPEQPLLCRH
jgi:hypothetical protein